ncbi:MAG: cysteine--tRNA ligase [Desulfobulbus propionicus]|nr:MAG: cysteine--tRNA ligase [Desulfobulbus propionicus]
MALRIYNTLTRKKDEFIPLEKNHVKLYVCGITSYDYCHIGHARSILVFDMVVRYLRYRGYRVTYIRNFTDIDDKIIKRAEEQNVDAGSLAEQFINEFYVDSDALGALRPDLEPRATAHITEMLEFIQTLIDQDMAYVSGGDVYFRVNRYPDYGCLSGRNLDDMQAGARIDVNELKEHPMDFVLWKAAKPGEPKWDSPWGMGRPGWHIECSAMSRKYLGDAFDIHGGGKDLIFPHHENEIAQSCGAGCAFARMWMHHGFVTIKDEKMSKSLGNFLTIRDVLKKYNAEELRLFLFSTQYRNPLDFSEAALEDARAGLERLYECLAQVFEIRQNDEASQCIGEKDREKLETFVTRFQYTMDNDFNTAQALGLFFDIIKTLNKIMRAAANGINSDECALITAGAASLQMLGQVLGIAQRDPIQVLQEKKQKLLARSELSEEEILSLIEIRNQARKDKDWATSDEVRDRLLAHDIVLKDRPDGTVWDVK